jgi:ABC-2 type transport system ATP-binding protein
MTTPLAIDVRGLSKSFGGRKVVDDVELTVARGRIYGFLGPNGSGKTTTIRMICGLLTPDAGEGTCLGFNIRTEAEKIKRRTGYMTQKFSLYQDLSVLENLGLQGRERQLAGTLSGGWKQRLALGACTLPQPELLLLDEPTAGVDPQARRDFWLEIHRLAAEGMTVLVSTHYMDEAERCHEIAYIAYGRMLTRGTVDEVIRQSGLHTFAVSADDGAALARLEQALTGRPGIDMIAPFGLSLHIAGRDEAALEAAIAPHRADNGLHWERASATLEDVFIDLMSRATDNMK